MAYEDWPAEFQELWDNLPVEWDDYSGQQYSYAEYMFEEGFMHYRSDEGYDPADGAFAREEFFDIAELPEDYFDWDGWREAMGYDLWLELVAKRSRVIGKCLGCARPLAVWLRMNWTVKHS